MIHIRKTGADNECVEKMYVHILEARVHISQSALHQLTSEIQHRYSPEDILSVGLTTTSHLYTKYSTSYVGSILVQQQVNAVKRRLNPS